jgi:hypothetical protein
MVGSLITGFCSLFFSKTSFDFFFGAYYCFGLPFGATIYRLGWLFEA